MQINRLSLYISISAFIIATIAILKPSKCSRNIERTDQIEKTIMDLFKKNPQIVLDTLSTGIINKKENYMQAITNEINKGQQEVKSLSLKIGSGKIEVICFFDPSDILLQKNILNNLKDITFYLIPLDLNDSQLTKLYYAIYAYDKAKLAVFIEEFVKIGNMNKALNAIKIKKEQLKTVDPIATQKIQENTKVAKTLQILSIPTLFISKDKKKFNMIFTKMEDCDY